MTSETDGSGEPKQGFGSGLRVLLLDDDELVRELVGNLLARDGFVVSEAESLARARQLLLEQPYDIAILDLALPDGNGLDIAQFVANNNSGCEVAVLTGFATLESAIEAMRVRVADYLIKPVRIKQFRDRLNRLVEHIRLRRQVKEQQLTIAELQARSSLDSLTGLYNHSYFQQQLALELARCQRYSHPVSLLFIDVDNFKQINDSCGHRTGDQILTNIAGILQGRVRDCDLGFRLREHDLAARYGGDEFVLLLPETNRAGASVTAERLRQVVAGFDFQLDLPLPVTLSIGLAEFPSDAADRERLIDCADLALYAAKSSGRNRIVAYSTNLTPDQPQEGWHSIIDLRRLEALEQITSGADARFGFVAQPIFESKQVRRFGLEILCRPQDDIFPGPQDLLFTAERAGKLTDLGRLLRSALAKTMASQPPELTLFVNLHPQELHDPQLLDAASPLAALAERTVLEINNSRTIRDQNRLRRVLVRLRELGFRILLDDICQGYLGLDALVSLEPQFVKVPVGFLERGQTSKRANRLIRHFLDTAAGEGARVIVTNVETSEQQQLGLYYGCELLQGFLVGKPENLAPALAQP